MTTIQMLAFLLCVSATNIALATEAQQSAACKSQPAQMQEAYIRQAKFILGRLNP